MRHVGDITKLDGSKLEIVDCITGGSPCQDLSIAGRRAGLDGERSGLFMEQIRIVKEMREHDRRDNQRSGFLIRPRYMVWENVPGAFSSNGGKDFQAVLTEIVRIVCPESPDVPMPDKWPRAGLLYDDMGRWSIAYRVHNAQHWGVAQRRTRIALVADFGGLSAGEILFERKGMRWDNPQSKEQRESAAAGAARSPGEAISFQERAGKPGGGKGILIQDEHVGALSTFNNQSVYCIEGHVVDRDTKQNGIGVREGTAHTLNATDRHAVVCLNDQGGSVMGVTEEHTAALRAQEHGHQPVVLENHTPMVMDVFHLQSSDEAVPALKARDYKDPHAVMSNVVRRLTPLECERLQGFPDGWTDIGEWVDSKGKKHKDSDSPRYKALGNSIAIPFWFYLLRRISAQYERPATLGSLFDGIGGFPYCWEKCNGKGTARWASEIEEFPIAVTKVRFPDDGFYISEADKLQNNAPKRGEAGHVEYRGSRDGL